MEQELKPMPKEAGIYWLIPGDYAIRLTNSGETIKLTLGYTKGPGLNYTHPKAVTLPKELWFKNDTRGWWSEEGVEHTFVIPRNQVMFVCEDNASYPKVVIAGKSITLNTAAACGPGVFEGRNVHYWTVIILDDVTTLVNYHFEVLDAIAEVALTWEEKHPEFVALAAEAQKCQE